MGSLAQVRAAELGRHAEGVRSAYRGWLTGI